MKKFYLTAIFCLCACFFANAQDWPNVKIENQAGAEIEVSTLNDGVPTIMSFWSTTCKPCIKELDAINELMEDWKQEVNFKVVVVSIDDTRSLARAKALVTGRGWEYTALYDKNQDLKRAMNVVVTPQVFVFDKDGKIVHSKTGYTPGSEYELLEVLKKLK